MQKALASAVLASLASLAAFGVSCARAADAPAAPATQPAAISATAGDWPAFHGGGELRGEAKPIGEKPLALRWKFKPEEDAGSIEGSAAIVGPFVYVGDAKGRLYCLNIADGKVKWTYTSENGFAASPLVMNGRIYVGDMGGVFHCVSADDGKKVWTYDAGDGQPIHAGANAVGDKVVFGNDGAAVICLSNDGKKVWQITTGDRVNSAPAISGGLAYVSGCDAKLRGIRVEDGKEQFAVELGNLAPGSPAILGNKLVMGLDQGTVVCFAADGSKTEWTYKEVKDGAMVYASPAISEGIVVVGARDRLVHAMNLSDGKQAWTFATRGDVDSSPAISGGRVFIGSRDKKLYVLDLKTGKNLGEFQTSRGIEAAPAIGQGVVVIGDTSGAVYCLEPK